MNLIAGSGQQFTVVGDDDQSIYRFRGATVRNILSFKDRYPEAKIVKLEDNFRSKIPIVRNSQQVIVHNPVRVPKNLMSVRGIGSDVLLVHKKTQFEEANASVDLLQRLHSAGKISSYRDVAILLRSVRYHGGFYIRALQEANIPFEVIGDASLFKRREILNLCDLLKYFNITGQWGDRR
jgi:DNA helicase-2/ATP-dependent DNA helicase PcrA